jgi:hypothetical protein
MANDILALEGEWEKNPKHKTSIEAALRFIKDVCKYDYHHRRVALKEDFFFYLKKAKYKHFAIVYLAFHGSEGCIYLGDKKQVLSLNEIAESCGSCLEGKIVHFGSCSTLNLSQDDLLDFKKGTGAKHVSGYTTYVDFVDGSIFDIAYFTWLGEYIKTGYVDNRLKKEYPGLYERLGFVMV